MRFLSGLRLGKHAWHPRYGHSGPNLERNPQGMHIPSRSDAEVTEKGAGTQEQQVLCLPVLTPLRENQPRAPGLHYLLLLPLQLLHADLSSLGAGCTLRCKPGFRLKQTQKPY